MEWQYTPYTVPLVITAAITAGLAWLAWRRRPVTGSTALAYLMLVVAWYSVTYAYELAWPNPHTALWWTKLQYFSIATIPVIWLIFGIQYAGWSKWLTPRTLALLSIMPAITILSVWTNEWHHQYYAAVDVATVGDYRYLALERGPLYWLHVTYSYLAVAIGTLLCISPLFRPLHLYRRQAVVLLFAALVPWSTNAIYLLGKSPVPYLDITPFAFALSGLLALLALSRLRLLDVMPVALHAVLESMRDGVIVLDMFDRLAHLNPAAQAILGLHTVRKVGVPAVEIFPNWADVLETRAPTGESTALLELPVDSTTRAYEVRTSPLLDQHGELTGWLIVLRDVTARKRDEERLTHLAYYDGLTGLPNRFLFNDRLLHALSRVQRTGQSVAVLFLDLDRFKEVNDAYGHAVGDLLLREVAERVKACVREADTVARISGDEFIIILADLSAPRQDAERTAARIGAALAAPMLLEGHTITISASIGITVAPADGQTTDELLRNADIAMYRAKREGWPFHFFAEDMQVAGEQRRTMQVELCEAIAQQQFQLEWQPQVDLSRRRVASVEALLRWSHPTHGHIAPNISIALAEDAGVIAPLTTWIIDHACAQLVRWRQAGQPEMTVAVNLSGRQLEHPDTLAMLDATLRRHHLPPDALVLEIKESAIMREGRHAAALLQPLADLGVRIAIDDFGQGQSSFGYLKELPVHLLKIDRSYTRNIQADWNDAAIVQAMIVLSRALGLITVAECVETPEQLRVLRDQSCDRFQGYLFSPPLSTAACTALFADPRTLFRHGARLTSQV
jgi:diguanylate cyclase (GGDEF)-like protein/PAS domain S-box-containing protein